MFRVIVLVPSVNEARCIRETIEALRRQTRPPDCIIVGDHNSTDGTGDIARSLGVPVVRCLSPIKRKGANLQNIYQSEIFWRMVGAHPHHQVIVITIDADTRIDCHGIEKLLTVFCNHQVTMACGYVLPAEVRSIWQMARLFEYESALNWQKRIQAGYGANLVCSGCFTGIRLDALCKMKGFPIYDIGEDMYMTWEQLVRGHSVRFVPEALCYTQEPSTFRILLRQLERWSIGFFSCFTQFRGEILSFRRPAFSVFALFWLLEGILAPFLPLLTFGILAGGGHGSATLWEIYLISLAIDIVLVATPAVVGAVKRKHLLLTLLGLPCFYLLRLIAIPVWWWSLWMRWIVGAPEPDWAKGH